MHRDDAKKLALEIDRIEADLRGLEHALYRIRETMARTHNLKPGEYGFIDGITPK